MPRGPAPSGRGPGETLARAAHAPGDSQPDPTWGWDVAGEPIDETEGWRPVPAGVDPLADPARWEAWLACSVSEGPPPDPEGDPGWCPDPEDPALPGDIDLEALRAESRRVAAGKAAGQAAEAEWAARQPRDAEVPQAGVTAGRRGPGMPGSARRVPGEYAGPAGGFGTGQPLDVAPGGGVLLGFAEDAAGTGDRFAGASDDELAGVIAALDRAEATACSLKHAALAAFLRRRPAPGHAPGGPAELPAERAEFAGDEVGQLLAEGRGTAEGMLAAKDARVQRWAEDSGNAALAGRELPPAEVLAADQRISWWARQLKKAGLAGSMDELRARAYLDLLLDKDSRPAASASAATGEPGGCGGRRSRRCGLQARCVEAG